MIAALFVETNGVYFNLPDVDPWDVARDARLYPGPHPVVAHPPCGPWSALKHLYRGNEHDCAPAAVAIVRRWGGVLEHPANSGLWSACQMPEPDELSDGHGFTICVDQVAWGHVARKRSWIYMVGVDRAAALAGVRTGGTPTHWVSGFRSTTKRRKHERGGIAVPPGIKVCSAQQRRRTPPAFAAWLIDMARSVARRAA